MSFNIPDKLRKYVLLTTDGKKIDRFKCPIPGCNFTTRLGPGALRMHMLMKSDPNVTNRYDVQHEKYFEENLFEMDDVRTLSLIPRIEI